MSRERAIESAMLGWSCAGLSLANTALHDAGWAMYLHACMSLGAFYFALRFYGLKAALTSADAA